MTQALAPCLLGIVEPGTLDVMKMQFSSQGLVIIASRYTHEIVVGWSSSGWAIAIDEMGRKGLGRILAAKWGRFPRVYG